MSEPIRLSGLLRLAVSLTQSRYKLAPCNMVILMRQMSRMCFPRAKWVNWLALQALLVQVITPFVYHSYRFKKNSFESSS